MVQFDTIIFVELLRTILVSSCGLKKSHYNSRVSLHESPTKKVIVISGTCADSGSKKSTRRRKKNSDDDDSPQKTTGSSNIFTEKELQTLLQGWVDFFMSLF